ncbi:MULTISPECIES: hypothetical protein [unclassified Variovorax]|uniref:hypothetical protein n=1 Tax=unclassified Variovorax TaxID=663243 RepID=UPI0011AFADF2|nr:MULTISPECIES: hypothetical protein [unclassified Variovorax]
MKGFPSKQMLGRISLHQGLADTKAVGRASSILGARQPTNTKVLFTLSPKWFTLAPELRQGVVMKNGCRELAAGWLTHSHRVAISSPW